jgi:hypothetical protein
LVGNLRFLFTNRRGLGENECLAPFPIRRNVHRVLHGDNYIEIATASKSDAAKK